MNTPSRLKSCFIAVVLALTCFCCRGCILGWALAGTVGTQTVKAEYPLLKVPTLILVEDYSSSPKGDLDADRLGRDIAEDLTENKIAPMVDADAINHLRDSDPAAYAKMSIADIGRGVGAKQVVYVDVRSYTFDNPPASEKIHGKVVVFVKVVSSETGQTLWPKDSVEGNPVTAESDFTDSDPTGANMSAKLDLNDALSEKVGDLFHDYQPEFDSDVMGGD
jgi:hypothetical protein